MAEEALAGPNLNLPAASPTPRRLVVVVVDGASLGIMSFAFGVFDAAVYYGALPELDVRIVSGEPDAATSPAFRRAFDRSAPGLRLGPAWIGFREKKARAARFPLFRPRQFGRPLFRLVGALGPRPRAARDNRRRYGPAP